MKDLKILYHGQIQLLGWGESQTRGKYLNIRLWDIENDPLAEFRGLDTGVKAMHILNCTISQGDILEIKDTKSKDASKLYSSGFFYAPKVLDALGSDEQYRHWIQKQPSALSGNFSEYVDGEGRCEAAHVRRANNAGFGMKPEYSCIPLTHKEHYQQHTKGETSLGKPVEWFESKRNEYLIKWAKETLLSKLGNYSRLRDLPKSSLCNWCSENDLTMYLPKEYRGNHDSNSD